MSALVTAFGQVARAAAKALENAGRLLEVAPYVEHRKCPSDRSIDQSPACCVAGILRECRGMVQNPPVL